MNRIRLATPEEIKAVEPTADLDQTCRVFALDTQMGTPKAVVRTPVEVDPAFYPEGFGIKQIALFTRDIETVLCAQGVTHYYFNVAADDTKWQEIVETWGAKRISATPEYRYKKVL